MEDSSLGLLNTFLPIPLPRLLASGTQQLLIAACTGDVAALEQAGEGDGEGPNELVFRHGWTVLHEACQWGQVGVVQELLQQGGADLCRRVSA